MKNLYPKSKGKIHPSPPPSAAAGGALAVLKLLPAAIFALTAALTSEDKEVVAYLMIRSINGSIEEEQRRCRGMAGGVHRPLFDCGCFDCYTSFWSRWDCSRDREAIHLVIEAFEEHLARKEKKGKESKRRRKKYGKGKGKDEDDDEEEKIVAEDIAVAPAAVEAEDKGFEEAAVILSEGCSAEAKEEVVKEEGEEVELPVVSATEKRRGWADVMGIFSSPLWSLWSPGA